MTRLLHNFLRGMGALVLVTSFSGQAAKPLETYQAENKMQLEQRQISNRDNARNSAILGVLSRQSVSEMNRHVTALQRYLESHQEDNNAKMFYGYGLLFLSADFLKNKNYFRAAELAKQGFFYLDEAAESDPDNWKTRFMRLRMDAFVSRESGRCVVSLKDLTFLTQYTDFPAALTPMLNLLNSRSQEACDKSNEAKALLEQVKNSETGQLLLEMNNEAIRLMTQEELISLVDPMLEEQP